MSSESVVSLLLNKISSFLANEVQLLRGVREEFVHIKGEWELMRAILKSADAVEESDEELKVWFKQIREVSHDAEDVIDEFTLLQTYLNHGYSIYGALGLLPCSVKNLKAHYRLANELQTINIRIKEIFSVRKRLLPKLDAAANGSMLTTSGSSTWHDRREDALLVENSDVVGIDKPKALLVNMLVNGDSGRDVVSVTGMGGMGKTTLVRKVYDDVEVKKHFKPRAWITVSQSFEAQDLLKDIIRKLYSEIGRHE